MSQGPLCPNLTQKVQKEVSQIASSNLSCVMLLGGLSVNLNHLKIGGIFELSMSSTPCRSSIFGQHISDKKDIDRWKAMGWQS